MRRLRDSHTSQRIAMTAPMAGRGAGDRWLAGERLPGVAFAFKDRVEVAAGSSAGLRGRILLLVALAPEPSYLVQLDAGREARLRQSALAAAPIVP